jgi:hypothetical protein
VVYAEGEIVDGEGDDGEIGGSKFSGRSASCGRMRK